MTALLTDTLTEFRFDPKSDRYRVREGAGKGQYISREAFLNRTRSYVDEQKTKLVSLGDRLSSGEINLRQFQREASAALKEIHTGEAIIGRGGIEKMRSEDWLQVGRNLREQYYSGTDPDTGKRFGIKWLAQDIIDGKVTPGQLNARLGLYAESGNRSRLQMEQATQVEAGKVYGTRSLGIAEHCPSCPNHEQKTPVPVSELVLPTTQCECRNRCKCKINYMTLSEAVAAGMPDPSAPVPVPQPKAPEEMFGLRRRGRKGRSGARGFG